MKYNEPNRIKQFFSPMSLFGLYLNTHGRMSRQNYYRALAILTACIGLSLIPLSFVGLFLRALDFPMLTDLVFFIPMFCWITGFITLASKRLHDMNLSGWWGIGGFIPLFGTIPMFIILFIIKGSDGDNRFGADAY